MKACVFFSGVPCLKRKTRFFFFIFSLERQKKPRVPWIFMPVEGKIQTKTCLVYFSNKQKIENTSIFKKGGILASWFWMYFVWGVFGKMYHKVPFWIISCVTSFS